MNLYFLVEGRSTERKVYPKWVSILIPEMKRIEHHTLATNNNYYLFSGEGFPALLDNHLVNTIKDINESGSFEYLILCIDADEDSVECRKNQVLDFIKNNKIKLKNCELILIIQNKCIETWFLANRKVFTNQPQSKTLVNFIKFYSVKTDDPELMRKYSGFQATAQFHEAYLKEMLAEKNIRYTKKYPNDVVEQHYLNELIDRANSTSHIQSFKEFLNFCEKINQEINGN